MANLSEEIQCASSDTRPPMLDRTDFASWQQCIRLYCRGKENGVKILKSIDEGPFQMGTFRETLAEGNEGALHLGAAGNGGAQNKVGNANPGQARQIRCYNCNAQENGVVLDEEQSLFLASGHATAVDEDVDEPPIQDLALNVDNVFQADEYLVYEEAGPSYDSDILSEVQEYDNYQDVVCEHHDAHEMHHDVQPNCVVDSNADYTSDSTMIPYDQYVKDNAEPVV
ncbi:hypothetical protein Tco_1335863 [Tanacetum coccineum]